MEKKGHIKTFSSFFLTGDLASFYFALFIVFKLSPVYMCPECSQRVQLLLITSRIYSLDDQKHDS